MEPHMGRKGSSASTLSVPGLPPLVHSLEKLYLGENNLTDDVLHPLMIFKELRVLNLSFNQIQDLPPTFFRNMVHLEELYLSGNKLTSIPTEDLPKLHRLSTLYLNGNRLQTLPQELGKVKDLTILDVGSNLLRYNINNWEFDWNWCVPPPHLLTSRSPLTIGSQELQQETQVPQPVGEQAPPDQVGATKSRKWVAPDEQGRLDAQPPDKVGWV